MEKNLVSLVKKAWGVSGKEGEELERTQKGEEDLAEFLEEGQLRRIWGQFCDEAGWRKIGTCEE